MSDYQPTKSQIAFAWYLIDRGVADVRLANYSYNQFNDYFKERGFEQMTKIVRQPIYVAVNPKKNSLLVLAVGNLGYDIRHYTLSPVAEALAAASEWLKEAQP